MKIEEIIKFLNHKYKSIDAHKDDFIGLQVVGKENIEKVMITLDITLDVIDQAITNEVDLIISHHPFFFGNKEDLLSNNKFLKSKYDLLNNNQINVFVIHTNIDFNIEGIANFQAKKMELDDIKLINSNQAISGKFSKKFESSIEIIEFIKSKLEITLALNTNILGTITFPNVVIASGASGDLIFGNEIIGNLFIVGEMKWHHWVYANEMNITVIEIGHFSEYVFKTIVSSYLINNYEDNLKVIESIEENGYSSI